jgi:uncharacterized protein YbjT (DUF2867 family)
MNILITGATGFIGSHLIQKLYLDHDILACTRNPKHLATKFPSIRTTTVNFSDHLSVEDWLPILKGVDVVINTVGIIRETGKQTFEQLHHHAPCTLFKACQQTNIRKVIQISAIGTDDTAFSQYHLTKKAADDCLKGLDLDWVIVKPSLVYGPGGKSAAFFKALSVLPMIPVVDHGKQLIQPIHIDDLTSTIRALLSPKAPTQLAIDAVGPKPITFKRMLTQYRHWLGILNNRLFPVPYSFSLLAAKIAGFLGNTPMNAEAVQMLKQGNTGDVSTLTNTLHIQPRSLDESLKSQPAQQADRWHARLYFLRPILRVSIGLLWIFTGIVSLGLYPVEQSYALLTEIRITGLFAPFALYGAAILDLGLGIATLTCYRIQLVGITQITLILGYSLLITTGLSEFWLHPFGPITKNIPLLIAILIMMALEKD